MTSNLNISPDQLFKVFSLLQIPVILCDENYVIQRFSDSVIDSFHEICPTKKLADLLHVHVDEITESNKIHIKSYCLIKNVFRFDSGKVFYFFHIKKNGSNITELKTAIHDINNILSSINNSAAVIKKEIKTDRSAQLLENIQKNTRRASQIIESALTDKIASSIKEKLDSDFLLNEFVNSFSVSLPERIQLESNISTNLPAVTGNYSELFRVLLNFISNSIEAISKRGKITLSVYSVETSAAKESTTGTIPPGYYLVIKLKDNGSGIKKKNLERIFEPKFSTKNRIRESGFGLNFAKKVISDHNGFIDVKSKWLFGTEFTVYLPAIKIVSKPSVATGKKRILVADDEESILELLTDLLASYGYEIVKAKDGVEVLKAIKADSSFDLLIIDHKMPNISGVESIDHLREMGIKIPVILTSGSQSLASYQERYKELAIDRIMKKPYDFEQMLKIVEDLLS